LYSTAKLDGVIVALDSPGDDRLRLNDE